MTGPRRLPRRHPQRRPRVPGWWTSRDRPGFPVNTGRDAVPHARDVSQVVCSWSWPNDGSAWPGVAAATTASKHRKAPRARVGAWSRIRRPYPAAMDRRPPCRVGAAPATTAMHESQSWGGGRMVVGLKRPPTGRPAASPGISRMRVAWDFGVRTTRHRERCSKSGSATYLRHAPGRSGPSRDHHAWIAAMGRGTMAVGLKRPPTGDSSHHPAFHACVRYRLLRAYHAPPTSDAPGSAASRASGMRLVGAAPAATAMRGPHAWTADWGGRKMAVGLERPPTDDRLYRLALPAGGRSPGS